MSDHENDKLTQILAEVSDIRRGLYGDERNKQEGLMQSHYDLKARFDAFDKIKYLLLGGGTVLSVIAPFVWDVIKVKFGI